VKGRRLEVKLDPVTGRPNINLNMPRKPGDYTGPVHGYTGDKPAVFFLKPNARDEGVPSHARAIQHVVSPPHVFTEEPDGTLTITASISDMRAPGPDGVPRGPSDGWHGHLTKGEWVKV
jgi:hypothetical protein